MTPGSTRLGTTVLGWPRIGPRRELKRATEAYWAGRCDADHLRSVAAGLRRDSWTGLRDAGPWTKLSLYCSERSEHAGRPLYLELIRRLRAEGAAGATALRGVWGYHGDHAPHGDRLLALRRHVPIVVNFLDAPDRAERWLALAAELSAETGLLTAETVPRIVTLG